MGYRLNCLDEPAFMAGPKPMLTEFGIHPRLESCEWLQNHQRNQYVIILSQSMAYPFHTPRVEDRAGAYPSQ